MLNNLSICIINNLFNFTEEEQDISQFISTILVFMAAQLNGISNEIISETEQVAQEQLYCAMQILEEQPDSVKFYDQGKLYLKSERILATEKGLFLCDENSAIFLPIIHSADRGSFVTMAPRDERMDFYQCSNHKGCGIKFIYPKKWSGQTKYPKCGSVAYKM